MISEIVILVQHKNDASALTFPIALPVNAQFRFLHLSPTCSYANSCFSGSISSLYRKGVILPRSARFKCYCIRSNNSCNSEKISLSSIKYSEKCQKWEQKALALPERSEKLYQKGIQ
uniref:Uncharacterized protein n=1 Tax=Salix viminalis TaxID=40686 RepID=A0A6N2LBL1_SALVM